MTAETIILVVVIYFGFYMAQNVGASNVANSMETSVGSGALSLKHTGIAAAIFNFLGAVLQRGSIVTNTTNNE